MYIKIDQNLYEKIQKITITDYEAEGEFIPSKNIEPMLEDLLMEIDRLEEKIEDIKKDVEENYRRIPVSVQVGISDKDFI